MNTEQREKSVRVMNGASGAGGDLLCRDVLTLLLWVGCVAVGLAGFVFPYPNAVMAAKEPEAVQAEVLDVQLAPETMEVTEPDEKVAVSQDAPPAPPALEPVRVPTVPPMAAVAVAAPSVALAFALPVEGPVRVVEAAKASYAAPPVEPQPVVRSAPVVQTLTMGTGEGRQPAPHYPAQAQRAGQEGTVRIRMSVDETGRVADADVVSACPWALLNQAALKVVRERWKFSAGAVRLYEVAIRFELSK